MKTVIASSLVCLLLTLAPSAHAQSITLDQVLTQMEQKGQAFRSMEASIDRTKVTVIVNDEYKDSGKAYFDIKGKETRIKFDFLKPEPQSLTVAQGKVLLYTPKLKQAQEYSLGTNQDKTEFMLVGFGPSNKDIRRLYNTKLIGEEVLDGKKTTVIELVPKSPQLLARFKSIRLWIDQTGWYPLQTKVTEGGNDYQVVKFTNIKMNTKLNESIFSTKLPGDVKKSNMGTIKL